MTCVDKCGTNGLDQPYVHDTFQCITECDKNVANIAFRDKNSDGYHVCQPVCTTNVGAGGLVRYYVNTSGVNVCSATCPPRDIEGNLVEDQKYKIYRGSSGLCMTNCEYFADQNSNPALKPYIFTGKVNGVESQNQCSKTCPPTHIPNPDDNTIVLADGDDVTLAEQLFVVYGNDGNYCEEKCLYAYQLQTDIFGNTNQKVCKRQCGPTLFLTKDEEGKPVCRSQCTTGTFYFINTESDRECLGSTVTTTTGCPAVINSMHNYTRVRKYFTIEGANHLCRANCPATMLYKDANKECVAACDNNPETFKEPGDDSMQRCITGQCTGKTFFKSIGNENICVDNCDAFG